MKLIKRMVYLAFFITLFSISYQADAKTSILNETFDEYLTDINVTEPWNPGTPSYASGNGKRGSIRRRYNENGVALGKYLRVAPLDAWPYYIRLNLNDKTDSKYYRISYDFMVDDAGDGGYVNAKIVLPTEQSTDGAFTAKGLNIAEVSVRNINSECKIFADSDNVIKEPSNATALGKRNKKEIGASNEWHTVIVFIDLENRKETIFFDNMLWYNEVTLPNDFIKPSCIDIWAVSGGSETAVGFDNLSVTALEGLDFYDLKSQSAVYPEYMTDGITAVFKSQNSGNVFFDRNIWFNISINNNSDYTSDGFFIKIYDSDNNCVYSEKQNSAVGAFQKTVYDFEYEVPKYGMYTIAIKDIKGRGTSYAPFSVCNAPPPGVKKTNYGIDTDFDVENRGTPNDIIPIIEKAGFNIIREQFTWETLDKGSGIVFNKNYNKIIELAESSGCNIMAIAGFGNSKILEGSPPETDEEINAYAAYCADLAKKLNGKAGYIEIWNEYMLSTFNSRGLPPEKYAQTLIAAYDAIKNTNKNIKVVSMAIPGVSDNIQQKSVLIDVDGDGIKEKISALTWLRMVLDELKRLNRLDCFDCVSAHLYLSTLPDDMNDSAVMYTRGIKNILSEYGVADRPLIYSESGWSTCSDNTDEKLQESALVRIGVLNDIYNLCEQYIVFNVQRYNEDVSDRDANFGILNYFNGQYANSARPAYAALCNYIRLTAKAIPVTGIDRADNVRVYKYTTENNEDLYVFWATDNETEFELGDMDSEAVLCDMYGNEEKIYARNGKFRLTATQDTQYLTVPEKTPFLMNNSGRTVVSQVPENEYLKVVGANTLPENSGMLYKTMDIIDYRRISSGIKLFFDGVCSPGTELRAEKFDNASYIWEYKKDLLTDAVSVIEGETDFKITVPNYCGGQYIRVRTTGDGKASDWVYVREALLMYSGWRNIENAVEYSPETCLFSYDGISYAMLDDFGDEVLVTITEAWDSKCARLWNTDKKQVFDSNVGGSIGFFVNTKEFKDANIPYRMQGYIRPHVWINESSASTQKQSKTTSKISLLSYNEYLKYIDKIGYMLVNKSNSTINGQAFRTMSGTNANTFVCFLNSKLLRTLDVSENHPLYPRAVFCLSKEFFKNEKLCDMGKEVKDYLRTNVDKSELYRLYSKDELADIGIQFSKNEVIILGNATAGEKLTAVVSGIVPVSYIWQIADSVDGGFKDIDGECSEALYLKNSYSHDKYIRVKVFDGNYNYYSAPVKARNGIETKKGWQFLVNAENAVPNDYGFEEDDGDKKFTFLDISRFGGENKIFILRRDCGSKMCVNFNGGELNIDAVGSMAYKMNTESFADAALTSAMKKYISEADFKVDTANDKTVYVRCKIMPLSVSEVRNNVNKIDFSTDSWWLRDYASDSSGNQIQLYIVPDSLSYIRTGYASQNTKYLRPAFYLERDYFKNTRINLNTAGKCVKAMLRDEFSKKELSNIYSAEELKLIFDKNDDVNILFDFSAYGDEKAEIFVWNMNGLIPLWDKMSLNLIK